MMSSNHMVAGLKANSPITAAVSADGVELNLYDHLMSFTMLTPEQQAADAKQHEIEIVISAPQPAVEPDSDQIDTEQTEAAAPVPQVMEPPRAPSYSGGITRAATISVYKSPFQSGPGERSDQGYIVLDAELLLSEDDTVNEVDEAVDKPVEESSESDEMLKASGPLDVELLQVGDYARAMIPCQTCGHQSDGQDMFCLGCGSLLNE